MLFPAYSRYFTQSVRILSEWIYTRNKKRTVLINWKLVLSYLKSNLAKYIDVIKKPLYKIFKKSYVIKPIIIIALLD
ncbi:MAG: hypothetical protein C0602_11415 [Denitrovibrio sp.]|nr:MAG: hypothetical protein C0602_11415 [Denitrovibrio sp.]